MRALALPRGDRAAVALGAVLYVLAFPPFHLFLPSFVCLMPAVWLIVRGASDEKPVRRHLAQGFWFGLGAYGLVLYWMVVALWHFTPLSAAGYAATVLILACWTGVLFATTGWITRRTRVPLILVFPVLWTALEWIVGHQGDIRFPWLGLGTSLTHYLWPIQIAELAGARGITFLLAAANTALALAWINRSDRRRAARLVAVVVLGVVASSVYGAIRMHGIVLKTVGKVAAIQPNVAFNDKGSAGLADSIFNAELDQSAEAITTTHPDLVLWPETAVPGYFFNHPDWEEAITSQARRANTAMLVGGLDLHFHADRTYDYYNAAFLVDSLGRMNPQPPYHKRYLVPIVERVPFVNPHWFHLQWFGGFGKGVPGPVYQVGIGKFGVLICYESAFEDLTRDYRRRGADFFVNITNDAWFGRTAAPYQHAAHLVMRAIETRAGIARGANDGISEFVDPLGHEYHQTRLEERAIVADDVKTTDILTLYTRFGDWVGWFSLAAAAALVLSAWRRRP